jgi:hypothetical protein
MRVFVYLQLWALALIPGTIGAQTFVQITDAGNPIVSDAGVPIGAYAGASWVDYDADGDLDLFVNLRGLYRNDGGEHFVKITSLVTTPFGNSWADFDNDGDVDLFVSGPNSFAFRNDGNDTFTKLLAGGAADTSANRGWGCAWGDYDNDGFADLVVAHPAGFVGGATTNTLLHNDGGISFTRVDTSIVMTGLAPYTVPTWSDYDLDGDIDLFFGSGPVDGTLAPDYLYRNMLKETANPYFERILSGALATDGRDGQVFNWIDYDNDGDLDVYITNYRGNGGIGLANDLYQNDGGIFTKMTGEQVGSIVTDQARSLASVWQDFDHDGDLDCFVTNDGPASVYYVNNGDGTFTRTDTVAIYGGSRRYGATAGDYDNDGDMDLFVSGVSTSKGLFRNESGNSLNWSQVECFGDPARGSSRSALGARVRMKATVNGTPTWQLREVSAQNSFNSQNSLRVHFGLGNATLIDSLIIEWPSDSTEVYTNLTPNHILIVTEGQGLVVVDVAAEHPLQPASFKLHANYPNPFNPSTVIGYRLSVGSEITLRIFNVLGQEVRTLVSGQRSAGQHSVTWDGRDNAGRTVASGVYLYRLKADGFVQSRKMMLLK